MPRREGWIGAGLAVVMLIPQVTMTREAPAGPPLLLVSGTPAAYRQAQRGVAEALAEAGTALPLAEVNLQDPGGEEAADRALKASPRIVVAVGTRAARLARELAPASPLVYALVLDPASAGLPPPGKATAERVTGVSMDVTLAQQFAVVRELLPSARRVGVLYDPALSGEVVRQSVRQLESLGLQLKAQPVRSQADVLEAAAVIAPDVDILWAIPDTTVLTPANARALILLALRSRKPLLAMSEGYVANGALAAVSADPYQVGRRAGELASRVLKGASPAQLPPEMPPRTSLFLNVATAQRLGIDIPEEILLRAREVYGRPAQESALSR